MTGKLHNAVKAIDGFSARGFATCQATSPRNKYASPSREGLGSIMTLFRVRAFELEAQAIRAREVSDVARFSAILQELNDLARSAGICPVDHGLGLRALNAWLDRSIMTAIDAAYVHIDAASQQVDHTAIETSRAFVTALVGVDLSSIRIIRCEGIGNEEASAFACGVHDHVILLPPTGFKSVDLLVHEFGHVAEFLVRRSSNDDWMLTTHRPASEAVAYFCQFSYLLRYGSEGARQLAIAAFMFGYLAIQVLCAASATSGDDLSAILAHDRFAVFRTVYPANAVLDYISQVRRQPAPITWEHTIYPLLGIPIALNMIREQIAPLEIMRLSAKRPMEEALCDRNLDALALLDFRELSHLFSSFLNGTLATDRSARL